MGSGISSAAAGWPHRLVFTWDAPDPACANLISNKSEVDRVGDWATSVYEHPITYPDLRIYSYHMLTYLFRFTNQKCPEGVSPPRPDSAPGIAVSKTVI